MMRTPASPFVRPVALFLALLCLLAQPVASANSPDNAALYVVFQLRHGVIAPAQQATVTLAAPLKGLTEAELAAALAQPARDATAITLTVTRADGSVAYRSMVEATTWLRAEFHGAGEGAPIDGQTLPLEESVFVARLPLIPDATLTLSSPRERLSGRWEIARLIAETPAAPQPPGSAAFAPDGGSPANRVDILLMGDGYTSAERAKFQADAATIASRFTSVSPLSNYANFFNITSFFTPSAQSGADHPRYDPACSSGSRTCCADVAMQSDPLNGRMVSTAFDARYCTNGIHRLLTVDNAKVFAAAAAVPDWDAIILIVNDTTYGGSGGQATVISTNSFTVELAHHEFGHSFARLADEYESYAPGYPRCSDMGGPACEDNVTDIKTRAQIKWAPWFLANTPIPTPEQDTYRNTVGLFEGARYLERGMYRPGLSCVMRSLGAPFCPVPSQVLTLRLYRGGWGEPFDGIHLIERDASPAAASPGRASLRAPIIFRAVVLQPAGSPPLDIAWYEDGVRLTQGARLVGDTAELTYVGSTLGAHRVTLRVTDTTPLVHPAMTEGQLSDTMEWDVDAYGSVLLPLLQR